jgi:hypothetical protein
LTGVRIKNLEKKQNVLRFGTVPGILHDYQPNKIFMRYNNMNNNWIRKSAAVILDASHKKYSRLMGGQFP